MKHYNDLYSPISFGGGGSGGGGASAAADRAITSKMDSDYSSTSQSYYNAIGGDRAMTRQQRNLHAAYQANIAINGWPGSRVLGGCTSCHQGRYDTMNERNPDGTYRGP